MLKILLYVPHSVNVVGIHRDLVQGLANNFSTDVNIKLGVDGARHAMADIADYDLIHFFGCWNHNSCQVASKAYAHGIPYILTPLGGLQPWEAHRHQHSILFTLQHQMVERAAAVHVCGTLEKTNLADLNWNKRVALVKNPVLTSQLSFATAAAMIEKLYRKVIDSNSQLFFSAKIQETIGVLLQTGIDPQVASMNNEQQNKIIAEASQTLAGFTGEDWRRILLYAEQELIVTPLRQAFDALQASCPNLDASAIERFESKRKYTKEELATETLLSKNLLLRNKVKEVFADNGKAEQRFCLALLNLHYELSRQTMPLAHLADIYKMMRFTDVDEDLIRDMIKRLGLDDFASRLTDVLFNFLGLPEGFWIFTPKDGKKTRKMLTAITKFGLYNY